MKWRERKRRHDDAHIPMGGRGKRGTSRKKKATGPCKHPVIILTVPPQCAYCKEIVE